MDVVVDFDKQEAILDYAFDRLAVSGPEVGVFFLLQAIVYSISCPQYLHPIGHLFLLNIAVILTNLP